MDREAYWKYFNDYYYGHVLSGRSCLGLDPSIFLAVSLRLRDAKFLSMRF